MSQNLVGDFLRKKWEVYFHQLDVNKDGVISMEDASIFTERFIELHKLEGEKVRQVKVGFQAIWNSIVLYDREKIGLKTFLELMEKEYTANRTKFKERITRVMQDIMDVYDVNNDGLLSEEEYVISLKCWSIDGLDRKYVQTYPQIKPGFICKELFHNSWVAFLVNDDANNAVDEKPIMLGFGMIDHV